MGQDASSLRNLENKMGYWFKNPELLKEAITHDSLRVNDSNVKNYQRLEHLGDSVIQLVITDYLFRKFTTATEGELSHKRSNLVDRNNQSKIANQLEINKFVKMAPGVQSYTRYDKFVEALIGAVYIDAGGDGEGYEQAKTVIYKLWELTPPAPASACVVV